ncbi:MAG TPA: hypothetical protein VKY40_04690, partial [Halanaerobiales bacterium]|nr:hypothetical protein [Halanaerobiales bacterium]
MISKENMEKLKALNNENVLDVVEMAVELCKPEKVSVITDNQEDIDYVRQLALKNGEEKKLTMEGHTYHYDSYYDQARDKENTRYLLSEEVDMGLDINWIEKEKGLKEVLSYLDGAMAGHEMLVRFFSLGPTNSHFTIHALQ